MKVVVWEDVWDEWLVLGEEQLAKRLIQIKKKKFRCHVYFWVEKNELIFYLPEVSG